MTLRWIGYIWALPTTAIGMLFFPVALFTGGKARIIDGVVELHGRGIEFFLRRCTLLKGGASAMTLGHIVLGCDSSTLDLTRSHERVHVRQCECWGPFFLPAYGIASLIALARGCDAYRENWFERQAYGDMN